MRWRTAHKHKRRVSHRRYIYMVIYHEGKRLARKRFIASYSWRNYSIPIPQQYADKYLDIETRLETRR